VLFCFAVALDVRNNKYTTYSRRKSLAQKVIRGSWTQRVISYVSGAEVSSKSSKPSIECNDEGDQIGPGAFLLASSMNDVVALDHAVVLFDVDRKIGFVERFFLPFFVHELVLGSSRFKDPKVNVKHLVHQLSGQIDEQLGSMSSDHEVSTSATLNLRRAFSAEEKVQEDVSRVSALEAKVASLAGQLKQDDARIADLERLLGTSNFNKHEHTSSRLVEIEDLVFSIESHVQNVQQE